MLQALIRNYSMKIKHKKDQMRKLEDLNFEDSPIFKIKGNPLFKKSASQAQLLDTNVSKNIKNTTWTKAKFKLQSKGVLHQKEGPNLMTKDEFVNTVKKMYKSEVAWRKLVKNQTGIDKLCVDLIGPVGSKEWLNDDFDLIDDMLCKQIHNQHRIAKHKRVHHSEQRNDKKFCYRKSYVNEEDSNLLSKCLCDVLHI